MSDSETVHGRLRNGMSFRDSPALAKIALVKIGDFQHCRKDSAIQAEQDLD